MPRKPKRKREPPEGWGYTRDGLRAWDGEVDKFEVSLFEIWQGLTRSRASRALDAPDCREASGYLLKGLPVPPWKRTLRVISLLGYVLAGVLIREAFVGEKDMADIALFIGSGILIAVLVAILQETLLQK